MQQQPLVLPVGITIRDPAGGRYAIEGLLGEGGFGAVYLVRDLRPPHRLFALKEAINPDPLAHERFTFEGELLKRLNHPALPRVYSTFEDKKRNRAYMLMNHIAGRDLEFLQKEQPGRRFSLPRALELLAPIASALDYLHHQSPPIVHRDVKPDNIIIPVNGQGAVLVDFGIAKEHIPGTNTSIIRHGSPGYAAPEQYGSGTNPRTDLYGLAATLYTLLTSCVPPDAILRISEDDPLMPIDQIMPTISKGVSDTIGRAMSVSVADRYETVEQFWQELLLRASQQHPLLFLTSSNTSQALSLPITPPPISPPAQNTTTPLPPARRSILRPITLLPIILPLLLILIAGVYFAPLVRNRHTSSATVAASAVRSIPSPVHTPTPKPSSYPQLAASYAGTITDAMNGEQTALVLTNLRQNRQNFRASFQGLGLAGPITGTITSSRHIHFTMSAAAENETLAFDGTLDGNGSLAGTFYALDSNGYRTGEGGDWNLSPLNQ